MKRKRLHSLSPRYFFRRLDISFASHFFSVFHTVETKKEEKNHFVSALKGDSTLETLQQTFTAWCCRCNRLLMVVALSHATHSCSNKRARTLTARIDSVTKRIKLLTETNQSRMCIFFLYSCRRQRIISLFQTEW